MDKRSIMINVIEQIIKKYQKCPSSLFERLVELKTDERMKEQEMMSKIEARLETARDNLTNNQSE